MLCEVWGLRVSTNCRTDLPGADVARVLPPLVVQHLYGALLLQLQDGQADRVPPLGALRGGDPVPATYQNTLLQVVFFFVKLKCWAKSQETVTDTLCIDKQLTFLNVLPLAVQQTPDLCEVAVPLHHVVQHGGLHQEGVVPLFDFRHALLVVLHKHRWLFVLHVVPHLR